MAKSKGPAAVAIAAVFIAAVILVFAVTRPDWHAATSTTSVPMIVTTISGSMPSNATVAVNLSQETNNSVHDGFNVNLSDFYSTSPMQCSKQQISACNNNVPSQFICVNGNYSGQISSQYQSIYSNHPTVCPDFILLANISCGIAQNYCVVLNSEPQQVMPANSSS